MRHLAGTPRQSPMCRSCLARAGIFPCCARVNYAGNVQNARFSSVGVPHIVVYMDFARRANQSMLPHQRYACIRKTGETALPLRHVWGRADGRRARQAGRPSTTLTQGTRSCSWPQGKSIIACQSSTPQHPGPCPQLPAGPCQQVVWAPWAAIVHLAIATYWPRPVLVSMLIAAVTLHRRHIFETAVHPCTTQN